MLSFIRHRINKIEDLNSLKKGEGAEIDLRTNATSPSSIHLHHDVWSSGPSLKSWLAIWATEKNRGPLILNTKEDGLENEVLKLLENFQIKNFFFLDTALPTLVKYTQYLENKNFAVRFSKFEPIEFVLSFKGKADWVWVDCFEGIPVEEKSLEVLKKDFKICLVSPELQGKDKSLISGFKDLVPYAAAVCTKYPELWN